MTSADPRLVQLLTEALRAHAAGDFAGAVPAYQRVIQHEPRQPDAWCNLCDILRLHHRLPESLEAGRQAVECAPGSALALRNLGLTLADMGETARAMGMLRRALVMAPSDPSVLSSLAEIHHQSDDDEAALACHRAALEGAPHHPDLQLNVGFGLLRLGRLEEAEQHFVSLPGHPRAVWLLAYTRLLQGHWQEAWPGFAARQLLPEFKENARQFSQPRWRGEPLQGRTLLVWTEQGYGDALMALRLVPRIKALGARVMVQTYASLIDVLRASVEADAWLAEGDPLPPFDVQVPLLDLPSCLDLSPEEASSLPPLRVSEHHRPPSDLAAALSAPVRGRRIGLVWAGNPRHIENRHRSLEAARLAPLDDLPDITWFGLQVPHSSPPPLERFQDLGPLLRDFTDTAWALERLDALVTVDTATAHLAGALGRPVHLLLPYFPDWRWGWSGEHSPWYPTLRIHRQPRAGDWWMPLESVRLALA